MSEEKKSARELAISGPKQCYWHHFKKDKKGDYTKYAPLLKAKSNICAQCSWRRVVVLECSHCGNRFSDFPITHINKNGVICAWCYNQ